jgi:hypothetical protein
VATFALMVRVLLNKLFHIIQNLCVLTFTVGRNIVHGSDSVESAEREIGLWFSEGVVSYTRALEKQIYE